MPADTIEFLAYDHYGKPQFSEKDTVILYISKSKNGNYFHQKYQYDEVFRDKNGDYFSYLRFSNNEYVNYAKKNIKSFKTTFTNEKFNLTNLNPEIRKIYYPRKYYRTENNFAIPIRGIYLNELIDYRLKTTFKDL